MIAPRCAFLRQLVSLPLLEDAVTLIDQPTAAAEPVTPVVPTSFRSMLEELADLAILILDELDGDVDLEEGGDDEEGAESEPSLGSFDRMPDQTHWARMRGENTHMADVELDRCDDEPNGDDEPDDSGIGDEEGLAEQVGLCAQVGDRLYFLPADRQACQGCPYAARRHHGSGRRQAMTNNAMSEAVRARFKPKVEPTTERMGPLHDSVEHAIGLIDCAYFATHHNMMPDELGDPIRSALDDGLKLLRAVKDSLHDMSAWVK